MKLKLPAFLFFFMGALAGTPASGAIDVTCRGGDCLRWGWSAREMNSTYWADVRCEYDDCAAYGWKVHDSWGNVTEVECWSGGCFSDGWTERSIRGPYWLKQNACRSGYYGVDCLLYGWASNGQVRSETACRGGSCAHHGWSEYIHGRGEWVVSCKGHDCFRYGWTVYP